MDKNTVKKISQVVLMPGIRGVDFRANCNQIWITVDGHKETRAVVKRVEDLLDTKARDDSYFPAWKKNNKLNFTVYLEGLIIDITGYPIEKASAPTEAHREEITHPNYIESEALTQ